MVPGANGFFYLYFLYFFAHPGAMSPMRAISRIPVRQCNYMILFKALQGTPGAISPMGAMLNR